MVNAPIEVDVFVASTGSAPIKAANVASSRSGL